ncbi:MAG: putative chromosome-partitioning protein ParB [Syntrophomonadaceae bacterium]|nr:putative chromosome-partitioning protein ParB [Bacillota bacterium]
MGEGMVRDNLKIIYVPIDSIKPNEYNPKQLTRKEAQDLGKSIREFGMVDPLIVNSASNRKNILIGGHQRLHVLKKLGWKEVPVVYVNIADIQKEKELCLRLSKNVGSWDMDLLSNMDEEILKDVGFDLDFLYGKERLEVKEEELKAFRLTHILLSFPPEKFGEVKCHLEKILKIPGVEYEQSSN